MASRKAKPKKRTTRAKRPELTLTREVDALTAAELAALARRDSTPPPAPRHGARSGDELAQTVEVPSAAHFELLDAAEALLLPRKLGPLSARQVADAAGVGIDVFHAHFADMRSLLAALTERVCARAVEAATSATTPERAARAAAKVVLAHAGIIRAVLDAEEIG